MAGDELKVGKSDAAFSIRLPSDELLEFESVEVTVNDGVRTVRGSQDGASILLTTDGVRGFGYVCGSAGTIMSYVSPAGFLPHYLPPLLTNGGEPCGVEIGQPDAAFNAAVFDYTRDSTADYEAMPPSIGTVSITTIGPIQIDENAGVPRVQIRDSINGAQINNVDFP